MTTNEIQAPATTADDPELTITLRLSVWQLVYQHLVAGRYAEVAPVIEEMGRQVGEQAATLAHSAETAQAEAEKRAATIN